MIARITDDVDRRRHVITIAPESRAALKRSIEQRSEWLATVLADRLIAEERVMLHRAALLMLRMAE